MTATIPRPIDDKSSLESQGASITNRDNQGFLYPAIAAKVTSTANGHTKNSFSEEPVNYWQISSDNSIPSSQNYPYTITVIEEKPESFKSNIAASLEQFNAGNRLGKFFPTFNARAGALPRQKPKSKSLLGERLRKIREEIVASNIPLLDWQGVEREKAERRGGYQENLR
ncbi:MAG: hypothetical protein PUP90_24800 [Nostoc sp. S4]|nr:hypothetical protein [Nostoc sp. S4]